MGVWQGHKYISEFLNFAQGEQCCYSVNIV